MTMIGPEARFLYFSLMVVLAWAFPPFIVEGQFKDTVHLVYAGQTERAHYYPPKGKTSVADTLTKNGRQYIIRRQAPNLFGGIQPYPTPPTKASTSISNTKALGGLSINIVSNGTTCGHSNGGFIVNVSGGTPPYSYSENGYPFQSGALFTQKAAGTYAVTVQDAAGLMASTTLTLTNTFQPPNGTVLSYTAPTACTGMDGSITLQASGGRPPYVYTYDGTNFQSSPTFNNLASTKAGIYYLAVMDANGCDVSVFYPYFYTNCPIFSEVGLGDACHDDGWITLYNTSGGTAPYQYSLDGTNYQSSGSFTNLSPATYHVYTRDATGMVAILGLVVVPNCILDMGVTETDATCGVDNGSIAVNVTNGMPPFQYSLDGLHFQGGNVFNGLAPGLYTVYVSDSYHLGYSIYDNITVGSGCPPINVSTGPAQCGTGTGSITVSPAYGTPPYQYSLNGGAFQASNVFTGLASGAYTVKVLDANGTPSVSRGIVVGNNCPTVSLIGTGATCGQPNGSITAVGSNGAAPYQYSIDGTNFFSSNVFNGLAPGDYTVHIRDAGGQQASSSITINNSCVLVAAVATNSTCSGNNGAITAGASQGTAPYQYSIDGANYQGSPIFQGLSAGNYTVYVMDANNLTNSTTIMVGNTAGPTLALTTTAATCRGNDGIVMVSASGGTSPIQFSVNGGAFQGGPVFNGLDTGIQKIEATDANGCTASGTISVPLTNTLTLSTMGSTSVCEGKSIGLVANSNGATFSWSPSNGLNDPSILTPMAGPNATTKYYVTATSGVCERTDSITVTVGPAPIANAGPDTSICSGKSVQLGGSGGVGFLWSPTSYLDNPSIANPIVQAPPSTITYQLGVTDAKGCQSLQPSSVTITVTPPAKVFAGDDTSVLIGQPVQLDAVDIDNSGFDRYTWSPPTGLNDPSIKNPIATISADIVYTVTASTPNGCVGVGSVSIKVYHVVDIFVPNAFTPNGDGHNDVLRAVPIGIRDFKYFVVYNRWGQQVFYTRDAAKGWDGSINGKPQDTGTYVWAAAGADFTGKGIQRRGTVVLIR